MNQTTLERKEYVVHVTETVTTFGVVTVEAATQAEAEALAEDQFDSAEHDDGRCTLDALLLEEDGIPVVWCEETAAANPENPYRLCSGRRA